ncbi:MAG: RNA polymerase factor sigma-54 [Sphingomonadales bacterium]|jgi:RNA polymerase sigma-54 factor
MALGPRLDLRQSQQLVMTPQLQQAIKLLQLNNIELTAFVAEELERNPLLESGEERDGQDATDDTPDKAEPDRELQASDTALENAQTSDAPLDADYEDSVYNHDGPSDSAGAPSESGLGLNGSGRIEGGGGSFSGEDQAFDATLSEAESLQDHLLGQMGCMFDDPQDIMIASHLIDLVDDAGYIAAADYADVPKRLGCGPEDAQRVLDRLQTMDPIGVCARSLSECLKIQQRENDRLDPMMEKLLDHLDLLARGELASLKRVCQVSQEDLSDMIKEIQALNPKPGLLFGGEAVQTVVPDIYVKRNAQGLWHVELNSATLPRVLVSQRYYSELKAGAKDAKAREFLSDCLADANWLVKALDQRAKTIVRVATELVRQQEAFFEHGVRHLKPLNLRIIAEAIDMHESTVSRVTSNKYLSCNRGVFELKYFFTSAIASSSGEGDHSAEAVRDRIRSLIEAETLDNILSDDAIVEALKREEIDIARRTVAKYREAMRIPSSVQRRRAKKMAS